MKKFSLLASIILLAIGQSAFAVTTYNCKVDFIGKNDTFMKGHSERKSVVLAEGHRALINSSTNVSSIDLAVSSSGKMKAFVPDANVYSSKEITSSFRKTMSLESKFENIKVSCSIRQDLSVAYLSTFTNTASTEPSLSSCYVGSPVQAMNDFSSVLKAKDVSARSSDGALTVTIDQEQCIHGGGTNPDDSWCDQYAKVESTFNVKNCASLPSTKAVCAETEDKYGPARFPGEDYSVETACVSVAKIKTRGI